MLVNSLLCALLAVRMQEASRQKEAVAAILDRGGTVTYDHQVDSSGSAIPNAQPAWPDWLRKILGDDFFSTVVSATLHHDSGIPHVRDLTSLRRVSLVSLHVTDRGLESLGGLTQVRELELVMTNVTDSGMVYVGSIPHLEKLTIVKARFNTAITDVGMDHLSGLKELRVLSLFYTEVSDEGIRKLQCALPNCTIVWEPSQPDVPP